VFFHAESAQPLVGGGLVGILPANLGYRHLEVGSAPEGIGVPLGAGEMERWASLNQSHSEHAYNQSVGWSFELGDTL